MLPPELDFFSRLFFGRLWYEMWAPLDARALRFANGKISIPLPLEASAVMSFARSFSALIVLPLDELLSNRNDFPDSLMLAALDVSAERLSPS